MNIQGKVALVTGGAQRVGRALTLMLAQAGAHVIVNYNASATAAEETVAMAQAYGVEALAVQCDIADASAVAAMEQTVNRRFGPVDILINSAGIFRATHIPTNDVDTWTAVADTSLHGTFFVTNAVLPGMLTQGSGVIINVLDMSIALPWRNFSAHAAGKAGMAALVRQLALELAPQIRVNGVAPGIVLPPDNFTPAQIASAAEKNLLKRWGTPDDVSHAVRFLIEADFITGEIIHVDGGERYVTGAS